MAVFTVFSDAEARYRGINLKGWRQFVNFHTYRGKLGLALTTYFITFQFILYIKNQKAATANKPIIEAKLAKQQEFIDEVQKWNTIGRKFEVVDLKKL